MDTKATTNSKITCTRNYRMFKISEDNRIINVKRRKKLRASMQKYGFLHGYPILCVRDGEKHLVVCDGQHRLAIAEELNLPVYYIVEDVHFDIAEVNSTAETWKVADYAEKFSKAGNKHYQEGLEFCDLHSLPLATGFCLLAGTTSWGNLWNLFRDGKYVVKDREWADTVAGLYVSMVQIDARLRNKRFVEACMAVCRIPNWNTDRLLQGAVRCREKLGSYSTREAYLDMIEDIYNFGRKTSNLVPVKLPAIQTMRDRKLELPKAKKSVV